MIQLIVLELEQDIETVVSQLLWHNSVHLT